MIEFGCTSPNNYYLNPEIQKGIIGYFQFTCLLRLTNTYLHFINRFEHPAGSYKKIFETCEELAEPLPTTVTGYFLIS